jgi:small-conductance mechanosensitive channel
MNIERIVLAVAGFFVLASAILAATVSPLWLWFTGFVGLNLFQSAFTGFCPLALILKKFGKQPGPAF